MILPSEAEGLLSLKGAHENFLIVCKGSFKTRVPKMLATSCCPDSGKIKPLSKVAQLFRDRDKMKIQGFWLQSTGFLLNCTTTRGLSERLWAGPGHGAGRERGVPWGVERSRWRHWPEASPSLGATDSVSEWWRLKDWSIFVVYLAVVWRKGDCWMPVLLLSKKKE